MEFKISTEYDGKKRKLFESACENCGETRWVPSHILKKRRACSTACSSALQKTGKEIECPWCYGKFFIRPSKLKNSITGINFCSRFCKGEAQALDGLDEYTPSHYGDGASTYRKRALQGPNGSMCNRCGYKKFKEVLVVHHIDCNRSNNKTENLQVLCPTCHAETHFLEKSGPFRPKKKGQ